MNEAAEISIGDNRETFHDEGHLKRMMKHDIIKKHREERIESSFEMAKKVQLTLKKVGKRYVLILTLHL